MGTTLFETPTLLQEPSTGTTVRLARNLTKLRHNRHTAMFDIPVVNQNRGGTRDDTTTRATPAHPPIF
jgi:hypothetical protein